MYEPFKVAITFRVVCSNVDIFVESMNRANAVFVVFNKGRNKRFFLFLTIIVTVHTCRSQNGFIRYFFHYDFSIYNKYRVSQSPQMTLKM